ncbi:hypothetical protein sos41_21410 [Alphaproteobacteria bacterium SO-S41]|nr:hypothetical protein sos41_21410 [Alphaproteobacteria bacterium SO-S41]
MQKTIAALLASAFALGAVLPAQSADAPDPYTLTYSTLGPVTVGMKVADAVKALGAGWSYRGMEEDNDPRCGHISQDGIWAGMTPTFMAQDGIVTRIEVGGNEINTDKGIHVGSTEAQVMAAYGKDVRATPHAYAGPPAKYLTVWFENAPKDENAEDPKARGIQFVTDENQIVVAIYAGDTSIMYIEGCA